MTKRSFTTVALLLALFFPSWYTTPAQDKTADGWEMTTYYVVLLTRGPKWTPQETDETKRIQEEHLANVHKMFEAGKLILAGPFTDGGNLRGIFVLQVGSLEEAKAMANADPAVKAGRLSVEVHPWYSAKGIRIDQSPKKP